MKKVIFVLHRANIGGSCTSMANLLELLKERGYEANVFLMSHEGLLLDRIKNCSILLKENKSLSAVTCDKKNLKTLGKFFIRVIYVLMHKLIGADRAIKFFYNKAAKKLSGKYDTIIAYQENTTTDFVECIIAHNKIAWVHTYIEKIIGNGDYKNFSKQYSNFDKIVCVSDAVKKIFDEKIEGVKDKTLVINNTNNTGYIINKSVEYDFETDKKLINLVSVGRCTDAKKFDRAIYAAEKLKKDGFLFNWYIVGGGELLEDLKNKTRQCRIEDVLRFLGPNTNPYPIIKSCDFLVVTSLYEANPMVVNEALILHKPVISTAFSSVKEVIEDNVNGIICDNSEEGLYGILKDLFKNKDLQNQIKLGAENFIYDNNTVLEKVINIF